MFNTVKALVKSELENVDYFSATTDMWSSVNMTPYMSLTVHYPTTDWALKSRCLETVFMPPNHQLTIFRKLSGMHFMSGP